MEEALVARLLATTALTDLVGTRISFDERPQGQGLPAVTLQVIDGLPEYSDEGPAGITGWRVQVDSWATDVPRISSGSSTAKKVDRAVLEALPITFMQGGVEFQGVFPDSGRDFPPEIGDGGVKFYRRSRDLQIWHTG